MKNTLWLYKDSYQIEIREKEAHPPQVAIYRYKVEEDVSNSGIEGDRSRL
nr:hypothetical protein [uncultured Capnocytophaga sp.]